MACARCPYTNRYDVIWRDETDPELMAVMLRCCSGPELRILKGTAVLLSELYPTPDLVHERATALKGQPIENMGQPA